jgi:hypothetical protein
VTSRARRATCLAGLALALTGCGVFVAPSPSAGDTVQIVNSLVRRGMTITNQVAGDAGCGNSSLYNNAVRYDVQPGGELLTYSVYVFGWKSAATFAADKSNFDACVGSAPSGEAVTTVEHLPWRAYGRGWPDALRQAVDAALTEAGGEPVPVEPE